MEDIRVAFIKRYEKYGIDKVTIEDICEDAGISKPLFYRKGQPFPVFYETAVYIKNREKFFGSLLGINVDPGFVFIWEKQKRKDVQIKFKNKVIN